MSFEIAINQLPLNLGIKRASHAFWSLSSDGAVIAELHGLATDKFGNITPAGLPGIATDTLGLYQVTFAELSQPRFKSFGGQFMSYWNFDAPASLKVTKTVVFTGDQEQAMARWELAISVIKMVDALNVKFGYDPVAAGALNSNSAAELFGDLLGFPDVGPPKKATGSAPWVPGWQGDIATKILTKIQQDIKKGILTEEAIESYISTLDQLRLAEDLCFGPETDVLLSDGTIKPIRSINIGDLVLSFDPRAELGRGQLLPRRVSRIFRNSTTQWIKVSWHEDGEVKELLATPGHHFLDEYGQFPTIEAMLKNGPMKVVLASGELASATAERIYYSFETSHLFERAVGHLAVSGSACAKPVEFDAWSTYNFEVEELHTYVAGGIRVHNRSGILGAVGNLLSREADRFEHNGFWDTVGDHVSNFLHDVGSAINGFPKFLGEAAKDILSGEVFRGPRDAGAATDGYDVVPTYYENGSLFAERRFGEGSKFEGQKYQPGGDYDKDGKLSSKDLAGRNADLYEKFSKTAETAQEREYYARRAEEYKKQAEGGKTDKDTKTDKDKGGSQSSKPVLLDLDGNGVKIAEFDKSTIFMDGGDGLKHRTAWAGTGDGVLFYDAGDDNRCCQTNANQSPLPSPTF